MNFKELGLSNNIVDALKNIEIVSPTAVQEKCIPHILSGSDVFGKSQTGSGKTFAFGLPAIEKLDLSNRSLEVLIIAPTRELANQSCDELKKITKNIPGCSVLPIFGGSNFDRQISGLKKGTKIVVGTPGRLMDHLRRKTLKLNNIKTIVLDEADEMLNMGFREDIETILKQTNNVHQTVMFSATMPSPIKAIMKTYMTDPVMVEIDKDNNANKNIKQLFVDADKKIALVKLFEEFHPYLSIVFCNTKIMVEDINQLLNKHNLNAKALHGDMRQNERKRTMDALKKGDANILVATDVAARGIDLKNVDIVFNFDIPMDVEYYIHRIGRTGRAGKKGMSITLVNNRNHIKRLEDIMYETKTIIDEHIIEGISSGRKKRDVIDFNKPRDNDKKRRHSDRNRNFSGERGKSGKFRDKKRFDRDSSERSSDRDSRGRNSERRFDRDSSRNEGEKSFDRNSRGRSSDRDSRGRNSERRSDRDFKEKSSSFGDKKFNNSKSKFADNGSRSSRGPKNLKKYKD